MFNSGTKKEAIKIHNRALERYNNSHKKVCISCESLYAIKIDAKEYVRFIEQIVNSIANTPKEFDVQIEQIVYELNNFTATEEYAKKAYNEAIKSGIDIVSGAALGVGVAAMAPTALMGIATTFGTATTGTAISALSGAAAQKAAVAWIGRTFAGFAVKEGAGFLVGKAFLALAGPVGWGVTAVTTGSSLFKLSKKNKEIADNAIKEAKEIAKAREALDELNVEVEAITEKITIVYNDLISDKEKISEMENIDYISLSNDEKKYLGSLVNNALSLSKLVNETVSG